MTDLQLKLLEYIDVNYDISIQKSQRGEYIRIDLIPNADEDRIYNEYELLLSCDKLGLDFEILMCSYNMVLGDGLRMGRYLYFMQYTTKIILNDLIHYRRTKILQFIETL